MRDLPQLMPDADPTHDADRDLGEAAETAVSYNLGAGIRRQPQVSTSYSYRGVEYGPAVEENTDLVGPGAGTAVSARSGNAHWDGDDYELAGTPARGPSPEEIAAQDQNDKTVVFGLLAGLALLWWISRKG